MGTVVMAQAFNGAGDTTTPMLLNFFCFWLFKIPVAYLFVRNGGDGLRGGIAITAAYSTLAMTAGFLFRRGSSGRFESRFSK